MTIPVREGYADWIRKQECPDPCFEHVESLAASKPDTILR